MKKWENLATHSSSSFQITADAPFIAVYPENFKGNTITPMEGVSLKSALTGGKLQREQPLFWEHEGNRAMRKGDWKLVSQYDYQNRKFMPWELYNLRTDRSELNDLTRQKPELKNRMILEYKT